MNELQSEVMKVLGQLATDPSSNIEIIIICLGILVTATIAVKVVGTAMKSMYGDSIPKAAIIAVSSAAILLLSVVAARLYIAPMAGQASTSLVMQGVVALIAVAGIASPLCLWLHETKYTKALITVLLSIVCCVLVVLVIRSSFVGIRNSKASALQMKSSTEKAGNLPK